jgi:hypothetical protein
MILDTCEVQQGGLSAGRRQLRNDRKCDSRVFVDGHMQLATWEASAVKAGAPKHFTTEPEDYDVSHGMERALASS